MSVAFRVTNTLLVNKRYVVCGHGRRSDCVWASACTLSVFYKRQSIRDAEQIF